MIDLIKSKKTQSSVADYAKRMIIAEQLVRHGCKWPVLQELLDIKASDAQRLVQEIFPGGELQSRSEKGMFWFRSPGEHNIRMIHASFMYQIYSLYDKQNPDLSEAEKLLHTYRRYLMFVDIPVITNINRVHYLLSSIRNGRGFELRDCKECTSSYVAIGSLKTDICPSCERNQYINCASCGDLIEEPYNPGKNGNRRTRCAGCVAEQRKMRRRKKAQQANSYVSHMPGL